MHSRRKRRALLHVEQLESRYAPAQILNDKTFVFQDSDGDKVRVTLSKPLLDPALGLDLDQLFIFDSGIFDGMTTVQQHLVQIDLRSTGLSGISTTQAHGLDIKLEVVAQDPLGDGQSHVNEVLADVKLGNINIDGDLSKIVCGDSARGLNSLKVKSIGLQTPFTDLNSSINGNVPSVVVEGDFNEAHLDIHGQVINLAVLGNMIGGVDDDTGSIDVDTDVLNFRCVGNMLGNSGLRTARLNAIGRVGSVYVKGDIRGGISDDSGQINAGGNIGTVHVREITGNEGDRSGSIRSGGKIGFMIIGGDLTGAAGEDSGQVVSVGTIAGIKVANINGGAGLQSGSVRTEGPNAGITTVALGGSLRGGTGNESGAIIATGNTAKISIFGDVDGGDIPGGLAQDVDKTGYIQFRRIAAIVINGSLRAGYNEDAESGASQLTNSGAIRTQFDIGGMKILGNITPDFRNVDGEIVSTNRPLITASGREVQGSTTDLAIGSLAVRGFVWNADLLFGYDVTDLSGDPDPVNPDAQTGPISIGGSFRASNLVAGIDYGGDHLFGTEDDFVIVSATNNANITSKIFALTIKGAAVGTDGDIDDHYGITAEWIPYLNIANVTLPTFKSNPGPKNNTIFLGTHAVLNPGAASPDMVAAEVGSFLT